MSIFSSIKHLDAYGRLTGSFYQLNLIFGQSHDEVMKPFWEGAWNTFFPGLKVVFVGMSIGSAECSYIRHFRSV